jgi:hypothetical protein
MIPELAFLAALRVPEPLEGGALSSLADFLKYGVIGLALALTVLAFWLFWKTLGIYQAWGTAEKAPDRKNLWPPLVLSAVFMILTIVILVIAIRLPREPIEVTVALMPQLSEIEDVSLRITPVISLNAHPLQFTGDVVSMKVAPGGAVIFSTHRFLHELGKLKQSVEDLRRELREQRGDPPDGPI